MNIDSIINLSQYPLDHLDSDEGQRLIRETQANLSDDGSCTFEDFLLPKALVTMKDQALTLKDLAFPGPTEVSPYFFNYNLGKDLKIDADHPLKRKGKRHLKQVAADLIPQDHLLSILYRSKEMTRFLTEVSGKPVYQFKDPYQSLNISVMKSGGCQQWHFDSGQMVTTLLLQEPEDGGIFEYAANIRSEDDENYDEVKKVLDGESTKVKSLNLKPGMLSIFKGHYSLHRVTKVSGNKLRLQAILAYVNDPERRGNIHSSITNYGPRIAELKSRINN